MFPLYHIKMYFADNKCYLYIAKAVAWTVANRTCHSHGDSLLTIGNQLEQGKIMFESENMKESLVCCLGLKNCCGNIVFFYFFCVRFHC